MVLFLILFHFSNFSPNKNKNQSEWITHLSVKIKFSGRFNKAVEIVQCFYFLFCSIFQIFHQTKKTPQLPSWSPHKSYTPASLHLTFPLVTRVHLRRASDFRLTLASIVTVMHNKVSCYSPVPVRAVVSRLILNRAQIKVSGMFLDGMVRRAAKNLISR